MSASSPVAYDANVLLAAVTALSAAIAFVAALHLYARCLLPVFTWGSSSPATAAADAAVQCAVCLGEMEDGELGRLLPACRHVFHAECIDTWLAVSSTCPVCRAAVGAAEDDEPAAAPVAGVSPAS